MGRAIVRQPAAFLMDEPLSNLDAKLRVQMRAEIAGLQRELGVTTFYVTHDQVEAMTMGDRVAVIKDGYLQQVDTPQNLYDTPGQRVRRGLHRLAVDEPLRRRARVQRRRPDRSRSAARSWRSRPSRWRPVRRCATTTASTIIVGVRPEDFEDAALAGNVRRRLGDRRPRSRCSKRSDRRSWSTSSSTPRASTPATPTRSRRSRHDGQHGRPLPPRSRVKRRRPGRDRRVHREPALLRSRHAARHLGLTPARQLRGGPVVKRSTSRISAF